MGRVWTRTMGFDIGCKLNYIQIMKNKLNKVIPFVLVFLVLVGLSAWYFFSRRVTEEQRNTYEIKVGEAQTSYEAKDYSVSINQYYEATEIIPSNLGAYEGIISILLLKNRPADALNIVESSATSLSATDRSKLYTAVGNYYYENKDFTKAKELYQKGIGLGVENMNADLMLGKALLNTGKINDAEKEFKLTGYSEKEQIEANLLSSYIYSLTDIAKAKETISSVTPSDELVAYYDEFEEVLNSLDEDTKYNSAKLARIFLNNGYPYLAVSILEPIEADISEYLDGLYFLGIAYLESSQYQKAIDTFDKALILGGMESEISWGKARAYLLMNDLDSAIKNYSNSLNYAGKNISKDLAEEYLSVLLENKQYLKAAESVTTLLTASQEPYIYFLGIKSNYESNESAKISYYLEQLDSLELTNEDEKEYLYWRIKMNLKNEEYGNVDNLLAKLLEMDKYNPKYYLLLGKYNITKANSEGAKQALEKSIEYDLNNVVTEESTKLLSNIQ